MLKNNKYKLKKKSEVEKKVEEKVNQSTNPFELSVNSFDISNYNTGELSNNFITLRQLDEFMMGHKGFIAGGVFKNIFNKEAFKDIDVFFEKKEDFEEALKYFKENDEFIEVYKNERTVAFKHIESGKVIELIQYVFGTVEQILAMFDFTIVKFAYYKEVNDEEVEWKVIYHKLFFEHLHLKRLVIDQSYTNISRIANTYNRLFKYAKYGYYPCRETKVKIVQGLRELPMFTEDMLSQDLYNGLD